jgi:hypothetical protein
MFFDPALHFVVIGRAVVSSSEPDQLRDRPSPRMPAANIGLEGPQDVPDQFQPGGRRPVGDLL